MKTALRLSYLFVLGTLISCKSTKSIQDPTLLHAPEPPLYDYSQMIYYDFDAEKDSAFLAYNEQTQDWEQYIVEDTRYVVVTQFDYYLIRFESKP